MNQKTFFILLSGLCSFSSLLLAMDQCVKMHTVEDLSTEEIALAMQIEAEENLEGVKDFLQGNMSLEAKNALLRDEARKGHLETVQLLLANGADVQAKNDLDQETVLDCARGSYNLELVQFLLNQNAPSSIH